MGKLLERVRRIKWETWLIASQAVLLVLLCLVHGMSAGRYANFYPINGTFQNYNPVRRLMNGQIPYQDFSDYLGMGHLYVGTIFTILFGGSYRSSLVAFSFVTFGAMALICLVLGRSILKRWNIALAVTNFVLLLLLVQPAFFTHGLAWCPEVYDALIHPLTVGNSARFVRGLILPLSILLFWLGSHFLTKVCGKYPKLLPRQNCIAVALTGILGGICFLWSNDFGICSWLCLAILLFCVAWRRSGRFYKAILSGLLYVSASIVAVAILVEIFTLGHLPQWLRSTFGTGGFQGWYFNTTNKSYYFFNIDLIFPVVLQGFTALSYLILLLVKKATPQALFRYGVPAFINMTGFATTNAYKLLSSGDSRQVALACLFVTLFFEGCVLLAKATTAVKGRAKPIHIAVTVLCAAWLISAGMDEAAGWLRARSEGTYFPQMGGAVTSYAGDLVAASEFLNGESFFSTYASAQEVVEDAFQPSGVDYIIHALGDQERENYLESFRQGDFTYAATIREEFNGWAIWETRADWYFHRNLYQNWHPVFANSYELYWERGNTNTLVDLPQVEIIDVNNHTKKLVIQTDPSINGIADVYLDYEVEKAPGLFSLLTFQSMLRITNTGTTYATIYNDGHAPFDSNQLRPVGAECIPIMVVDGYGETTVSANPQRNCLLHIEEARCEGLYTSAFDYLPVSLDHQEDGCTVLCLSAPSRYVERYKQCLKGAIALELDGTSFSLVRTQEELSQEREETGFLYVTVEGNITEGMLKKQNMLRVIRDS